MAKIDVRPAAERLKQAAPSSPTAADSRPRVFVADGETGILDLVSHGLEKAGFSATTFLSGREFERAVVREAPDLCIMDLSLSDLDGVAILNELAAQEFQGRILLISGHSQKVLRSITRLAADYQLQIIGCVRKPFTMKPLLDALSANPMRVFAPEQADIMRALHAQEIIVRYQPIVDLPNHQVVAAEALVRWQHPTEGLLAPTHFVGKLDHAGMNELTLHVLRNVFQTRTLWAKDGIDIQLAVNVPTPTVMDESFLGEVTKLMTRYKTTLAGITLEITENDMISDVNRMAKTLSGLCLKGARVAVDDFGTGFSSLSRLQCLPVDEVKIDKSFVRHCATYDEDRKIVEAVIALAHALDMRVVAEGVETDATDALLCESGCDYAQGFLFGRPVSAGELSGLIRR
jgi:EAL domain-containing protein (putative c-di-GMP-specific phosphodiesterase class I)/ActR/RegA family two-component response regulator